MHVVDLDGAKAGRVMQLELLRSLIAEANGMSVEVGGGVREVDDVQALIDAGAARVVVGTKALEDWHWFEKLVPSFPGKIVLALDAKNGIVATRGWTVSSGKRAIDIARWVGEWPLAALLYTDVARDGMLGGPNVEQTVELAEAAGPIPVIASGGVGSIEHIRRMIGTPIWGAVVGRSLYEGAVDLRESLRITGSEGNVHGT
jgi:phosphoribosylformimino-5-aminoimidazole carboxamide ribotide isomerase